MEHAVRGSQAIIDICGGSRLGEAGIKAHPIGEPIETAARGGGISVVIGDPFGHIADLGVGVAIFIHKATINCDVEADVIDAIKDGVDGVLGEQGGIATIVLHQVVTGLDAVFVVAMQGDKRGVAIGITADPAIDPEHLRFAEAGGIGVGGT